MPIGDEPFFRPADFKPRLPWQCEHGQSDFPCVSCHPHSKKMYVPWPEAGGPNQCVHGYARGIDCPHCDSIAMREAATRLGVFERRKVDFARLEQLGAQLLSAIGEDPSRPGLKETPARFARMWRDFIEYDEGNLETTFPTNAVNQLLVVGPIKVWSKCEHHLVDFWTDITVGLVPGDVIMGLSKFARIAQKHAHRLQVQEQLVSDIATELEQRGTQNVGVYGRGVHLCMVSRGIQAEGSVTTNYTLRGDFLRRDDLRSEFMAICRGSFPGST